MAQMVFHEGRYKIVAMIIALMQAYFHLLPGGFAGVTEKFRLELFFVKIISQIRRESYRCNQQTEFTYIMILRMISKDTVILSI